MTQTTKETADQDIVERLRNDDVVWGVRPSLAFEAADEIERLREQLKYSNEFREIMNVERCDALEENERLREALQLMRDELDRRRKNAEEARP